jgi:hypothetical protein
VQEERTLRVAKEIIDIIQITLAEVLLGSTLQTSLSLGCFSKPSQGDRVAIQRFQNPAAGDV